MIQKLAEKLGEKAVRVILVTVTAMVMFLYHKIDKEFTKLEYYQKGKDDAKKLWEEQKFIWKERVDKVQKDANTTVKEKMKLLKQLEKELKEFIKNHKDGVITKSETEKMVTEDND